MKHHEMPADSLAQVASIMKHHLGSKAVQGTISPTQKQSITAFLQQPAGFQSYAPASGQIFGILKQMKETFESNLSQSQKDELAAQDAFSQLKSAKLAEIAAGKKQLDNKEVELADTDEANAQAKEDLADTRNALSADQKFLLDLKEKCRITDQEFEARQKARGEEISAVSEAIAILSDDSAHDMFSKTLGFVQVKGTRSVQKKARSDVAKLLKAAAAKSGNTELLAIASMAQLDAFTKVKAAIDEMVTALLKEKQDEIKHRDFCIEELAQNDKQNAVSTDEKNDLEANIASLESEIDTLTKDLAALAAEIKEAQVQVKRASEDRELENKEFQQTVADQRATQQILKKALDRLKVVYGFVQTKVQHKQPEPGAAAPPPPPGFSDYKQNAGAGGVLTMIQSVINDAKMMEKEAIMAEQDSQSAYESFVKNTNDEIAAAMKSTTAKTESKAKAEEAKADLKATMSALEQLASYAADVHQSCDFVLKNFEVRQEVEALRQAKAVLSGADFA